MTIYTAIFGKYDDLKEPTVITKGWKYICYTNNKNLKSDVWEIKYIDNKKLTNVKAARIIKIRFYDYIKDDLIIWCDASMQINVDLNKFVDMFHRGHFTLLLHPTRNCTYQEGFACFKLKKDSFDTINAQMNKYKAKGLPAKNGMVQTGLMIRNNTQEVRNFCRDWADELLSHSHRDQLSFNYIAWKNNFKYYTISSNILRNGFRLHNHKRR